MKQIEVENIKVSLYTDANEYIKDFFDIPKGAILSNNLPATAGFACIDSNEIFIYINESSSFLDLLLTVSHELGHLIEGGFKKNPPQLKKYDDRHEEKALHYENFVQKAYKITSILYYESEK